MILVILKCNKHTLNQDGHSPYPLPPKNYIQEVRWYDTIVLVNGPCLYHHTCLISFQIQIFIIFFKEYAIHIIIWVLMLEKKWLKIFLKNPLQIQL